MSAFFCTSRSRQSWSANCVRCRYETLVQQDGYMHQINNPEVEVNVNEANYIIEQQKIQLKIITGKLNNAFKGEEVTWVKTGTVLFLCGMFKYGPVECLLLSQSDNNWCCTGTNFGLGGQLYMRYNVRLPLNHSGSDSCTIMKKNNCWLLACWNREAKKKKVSLGGNEMKHYSYI